VYEVGHTQNVIPAFGHPKPQHIVSEGPGPGKAAKTDATLRINNTTAKATPLLAFVCISALLKRKYL
jgi:anthranilate/para-aminobenzoate synthase component II